MLLFLLKMPPGHFTKNRYYCILRLVKLFTLLLSCFLGMHIGFVPDFSCLFQSGRLFHLYMSKVWVCNIHPSGSWLQFLVCLFVSYVAIAYVFSAALYGKVTYFTQFLSAVFWDLKCLCTPRPLLGRFLGEKKVLGRRAFLFPFLIFFFKRCGVRDVISYQLSCLWDGWDKIYLFLYHTSLCDYTKIDFV